jgi:hypothetical protein
MISTTLARARENLRIANVPHAAAALLVDLRPSTLTSAFREASRLDSRTEARLLTVSARLVELRESFAPFGLPEDSSSLQRLVDRMLDGSLTQERIREVVSNLLQ